MIKDKHDPRDFEQFIQLTDAGSVASTHMFAVGAPDPNTVEGPIFINVSELGAVPLDHVKVAPEMVAAVKEARAELSAKALEHAQAFTDHAAAHRILADAVKVAATPKAPPSTPPKSDVHP